MSVRNSVTPSRRGQRRRTSAHRQQLRRSTTVRPTWPPCHKDVYYVPQGCEVRRRCRIRRFQPPWVSGRVELEEEGGCVPPCALGS